MFTGIVQRTGKVLQITGNDAKKTIQIDLGFVADNTKPGDSICVSGVCLTMTKRDGTAASFDVVTETLTRTNLGELQAGSLVNLEPSVKLGDELGGHMVSGHVDATVRITKIIDEPGQRTMWVEIPEALKTQIAEKGSASLDGISLTIASVKDAAFSVALIPHTLEITTLGPRKQGERLNLETDLIAKYVARYLELAVLKS